jgi:hypothetical protein
MLLIDVAIRLNLIVPCYDNLFQLSKQVFFRNSWEVETLTSHSSEKVYFCIFERLVVTEYTIVKCPIRQICCLAPQSTEVSSSKVGQASFDEPMDTDETIVLCFRK